MKTVRGEILVAIGFVMVLLGAILPFLIVLKVLPSTIFLNFFSYILSVAGLMLGIAGLAYAVRYKQIKKRHDPYANQPPPDNRQDW
jgi:mannose/fructose/N-acetylgalactosamine-specific phosphotransferase system component IIC